MKNILSNKLLTVAIILVPMLIGAMEQPSEGKWIPKIAAEYKSLVPSDEDIIRLSRLHGLISGEVSEAPFRQIDEDLISAALAGNFLALKDLLNAKADPNAIVDNMTPLRAALYHLNVSEVEELLKNGADTNKKVDGISPLDWATLSLLSALEQYQDIKKIMVAKGALKTPEPKQQLAPIVKPAPTFRPR